jgi:hypothetical protein
MLANVWLQPGVAGTLTLTPWSGALPVFVTVMRKVAAPPLAIFCGFGI